MQVLVFSDSHIDGTEPLREQVQSEVVGAVGRFGDRITRVEVYLSDTNSHKLGDRDKRCVMEAHVSGLKPIAVSHEAALLDEAIGFCADKLERAVDSTLGRIEETPGRSPPDEEILSVDQLSQLQREKERKGRNR